MRSMKKWDELRNHVIEALEQAEVGELHEQERFCRITLEKMDELDKKYPQPTEQDMFDSMD